MHLRRALLLFAIVLGVAAIAASLAPPPDTAQRPARTEPSTPPARPSPEADARPPRGETVRLRVNATADKPAEHSVRVGEHAIVSVAADAPGQVRIDSLGLTGATAADTPAVFDLFPTRPGRHAIVFAPAGGEERPAGTLVVAD